jgi:hypothetical protein
LQPGRKSAHSCAGTPTHQFVAMRYEGVGIEGTDDRSTGSQVGWPRSKRARSPFRARGKFRRPACPGATRSKSTTNKPAAGAGPQGRGISYRSHLWRSTHAMKVVMLVATANAALERVMCIRSLRIWPF